MLAVISCLCGIIIVNNSKTMANSSPIVYAEKVSCNTGDDISIPVKIKDNTGIMGFELIISYDTDALEIESIEKGDILSGTFDSNLLTTEDNKVHILWSGVSDMSADGVLFNIKCRVKTDYNGKSIVISMKSVNYDTFDQKYEDVLFDCKDIEIGIKNYIENNPVDNSAVYAVYSGQTKIENDEITIPVMLRNNRGIMGYVIEVDYDESVITPINIEPGTIVADNSIFDTNIGKNDGQLKVLWSGSDEVKDDGSMFNIIFKINDTSKETTDIKMKYSQQDTFDEQYKDVHLDISDISVSLKTSGEEGENVKPTETPMVTPTATPDIGATPTQSPNSDNSKPSENPMPTTKPSGEEKKDSGSSISVNKKENTSEKIKLKKLNVKSLKSISKGKLALKWNKSKDKIRGYEVQYSVKSNFKKKTVKKVSKNRTSLTITKLKSKKKYYVRIRSYMRYTSIDGAVKIIYSNWSNVKACKVK